MKDNPHSATNVWFSILQDLAANGDNTDPRGLDTVELLGYKSIIDMHDPIVLCKARKLNYRFMAAEAWWILCGRDDSASIGKYCKNILQFADQDDGARFFGAYGPKIVDQLPYVIDKLAADPMTRQAVLTIWRENPPETKDIPCTVSVQWFIRNGVLHCIDSMRSSDVWLGWPYDVFNFSMLSWHILKKLSERGITLRLGCLQLNAGSQHWYKHDFEKAKDWTQAEMNDLHDFASETGDLEVVDIAVELDGCLEPSLFQATSPFFDELRSFINKTQQ